MLPRWMSPGPGSMSPPPRTRRLDRAVVEVLRRTGVRIEEMLERECQKFGVRR